MTDVKASDAAPLARQSSARIAASWLGSNRMGLVVMALVVGAGAGVGVEGADQGRVGAGWRSETGDLVAGVQVGLQRVARYGDGGGAAQRLDVGQAAGQGVTFQRRQKARVVQRRPRPAR